MKKFFKLTKIKRLIIFGLTITVALITMILGSIFYVSKDPRKSIQYGGGVELVAEIKTSSSDITPADVATDAAQSIYERFNPLGVSGFTAEAEINGDQADIRATIPGDITNAERKSLVSEVTRKPQLVMTDFYGNPLFTKNGRFNPLLSAGQDPAGWADNRISMESFYSYDPDNPQFLDTRVPIANNGASAELTNGGEHQVYIELESSQAAVEWTKATQYLSQLPAGKNTVLAWLDPQILINRLSNFYHGMVNPSWNDIWTLAKNPDTGMSSLAYVLKDGAATKTMYSSVVSSANYLISQAQVSEALNGRKFVIQGQFNSEEAHDLARRINFGSADYSLLTKYSRIVEPEYGSNSFRNAMIAGIVVIAVIALILILNYGLLGALATISMALFIFITLLLFTIMRGEYSPSSIAALVIGIGMSVDAVIITFERFKSEAYFGNSIKKSNKLANRKSLSTILDSNITTLIVSIVLFYFGTRDIIGLSITLILSIISTIVVMVLFTRLIITLFINAEVWHDKKWVFGLKPKFDGKVQDKIDSVDYVKTSKWFSLGSFVIAIVGVIMFVIFAIVNKEVSGGFVLSQDFAGGSVLSIEPKFSGQTFDQAAIDNVKQALNSIGVSNDDISTSATSIVAKTKETFEGTDFSTGIWSSWSVSHSLTTTDVASSLVKNAMIAVGIAIGAVILYTLIRFKWTYSISAIVALLHDAIIVVAAFCNHENRNQSNIYCGCTDSYWLFNQWYNCYFR